MSVRENKEILEKISSLFRDIDSSISSSSTNRISKTPNILDPGVDDLIFSALIHPTESSSPCEGESRSLPFDLDRKEYSKRVNTFSVLKWRNLLSVFSPHKCSLFGWMCIDTDEIECSFCSSRLKFPSMSLIDENQARSSPVVKNYMNFLRNCHQDGCYWKDHRCPDSFLSVDSAFYLHFVDNFGSYYSRFEIEVVPKVADNVYLHPLAVLSLLSQLVALDHRILPVMKVLESKFCPRVESDLIVRPNSFSSRSLLRFILHITGSINDSEYVQSFLSLLDRADVSLSRDFSNSILIPFHSKLSFVLLSLSGWSIPSADETSTLLQGSSSSVPTGFHCNCCYADLLAKAPHLRNKKAALSKNSTPRKISSPFSPYSPSATSTPQGGERKVSVESVLCTVKRVAQGMKSSAVRNSSSPSPTSGLSSPSLINYSNVELDDGNFYVDFFSSHKKCVTSALSSYQIGYYLGLSEESSTFPAEVLECLVDPNPSRLDEFVEKRRKCRSSVSLNFSLMGDIMALIKSIMNGTVASSDKYDDIISRLQSSFSNFDDIVLVKGWMKGLLLMGLLPLFLSEKDL